MEIPKTLIEKIVALYPYKPEGIKIWPMDGSAKATTLNGHPKYFFSFTSPDEYIWLDFMYPNLKLDGIHYAKTELIPDNDRLKIFLTETHYDLASEKNTNYRLELDVTPESFIATRFWVEPDNWINCKLSHHRELVRTKTHQFVDTIHDPTGDIAYSKFVMYESRILLHLNNSAPVSTSKLMTISYNQKTGGSEYTETLIKLTNGMPAYFSKYLGPDNPEYEKLTTSPVYEFNEVEYRKYYESLPLRLYEL